MRISIAHLLVVSLAVSLAPAASAADWTTFGGSPQRLNYNADETVLSSAAVPGTKLHWKVPLPFVSDTQPLFVSKLATANGTHDEVFATTQNGWILALNAATGATDWSVQTPAGASTCPGFTVLGVFGTPTISLPEHHMFVVDGLGNLHALDIRNGQEAPGYPVEVIDSINQPTTFNHSSPTLIGSTLYITTSGPCETLPDQYHGQVIAFDLRKRQVLSRFYPIGNTQAVRGGGMWGPGGVSAETDGSLLYAATGNAIPAPDTTPHAEEILQFDPNLNLVASNGPSLLSNGDFDFATTPLLIDAPGCPPMVEIMNKTGLMLFYQRSAIAAGPVQTLTVSNGGSNSSFIGMPSYDPVLHTVFVNNPVGSSNGNYTNGVVALQVNAACMLSTLWQSNFGADMQSTATRSTAPVLANGVLWVSSGGGRQLMAFDEATGTPLWNSGTIITAPTRFTPTVANGQVFVHAAQTLYAFGL